MKIGYARVSTADQNLARQIAKLNKVGVERIYQEKLSGKDMRRPQLRRLLRTLKHDDEGLCRQFR